MHSFSLPHPVQCQEMRKCLITLFDQQTRYFRSTWKSIDTTLSSKSLSNISQNDTPPQTRIMLILLKLHLFNFISRSYQIPDGLRPQCLPPIIIKAWLESSRQTLDPIHFRKHQGFWNSSGKHVIVAPNWDQKHGLLDHCWTDPFWGSINHYALISVEKCWSPLVQPVKIPRFLHQDVPKCRATTPQRRWTMHAPRRHILGISFGHHEGKCDHELEESRQNAATEKINMSIQHSAINAYWFLLKGDLCRSIKSYCSHAWVTFW